MKGDVDRDGDVDTADAAEVLFYFAKQAAGLEPFFGGTPEEHAEIFPFADVDEDGIITINDASFILSYFAMGAAGLNPTWEDIIAGIIA